MKRYIKVILLVTLLLLSPQSRIAAEETLVWQDCVKEAKENHPDLISAEEKLNQAEASKDVVRSGLLPQIDGDLNVNKSKGATISSDSDFVTVNKGPKTTYSYGVTGQQLIFDGFKTANNFSSAKENVRAMGYNYDVTSSNIRLRLRTAFANLLTAQEYLRVTEGIAERRKQNLDLVTLRYEGGREHRGSLMTSQADLAQALFDVAQAKRSISVSQARLIKELGRPKKADTLIARGDFEVRCADREKLDFENLAETNPFLQQLMAQKEAAKYGVKSTYGEFYPAVYGNGGAGMTDSSWPPGGNEWSIGVSASMPIFEGGKQFADVAKAKAVLGQAQADERSGRDGVIFTLENTWTTLQNAIDNVEVQKKFLEAAQERAKISEAEYSNGLLSFDNWVIIEDNLVSAKKNYLNVQMSALLAEANWIQAKGGTLDYDQE